MMPAAAVAPRTALRPPAARVAAVASAAGLVAFTAGVALGQAPAALAALAASWLFFAGLAAGSVAFVAAVRLSRGRWAGPVLPTAEAAAGFFGPALVLLGVLVVGARAFVPWAAGAGAGQVAALAVRQLAPTAVLFGAGARLVAAGRRPGGERAATSAAVVYLVAYAAALSFWAYDWVLSLEAAPPATALPAYYFLGAFLCGLAWVALSAALRGEGGPDLRHDLGKLLFGFVVVWSYLLWALFLAAWYGGVPAEIAPLLARWRGPWKPIAMATLVAVFLWPFWLFLSERLKRRRDTLAAGAAAILVGLLAERFLLVLPALPLRGGPGALAVGAGVTIGVAGLFALRVGVRIPARD
ncbi:MAG TPA: hypothetical protein VLU43_11960 [Anaeromyxobacteraceae bacterium]|nr:hypothetical protein [Anaeromyxobacteraceae bacterium]